MSGAVVTDREPRALRILLVANDGFSAGHVVRTIAISRALARAGSRRHIGLRMILATTSEAHALLASEPLAIVTLPAPLAARRGGFSDGERRRIVGGTLAGLVDSFGPDLLVADTFPSGPHGELAGIAVGRAKRALIRRSVPDERTGDTTLSAGLSDYDLAVVADDPSPTASHLPTRTVRVPPITIGEARDGKSREHARAELGLPAEGRAILVASGGGGDEEAVARATSIAEAIARLAPDVTVVLALGPLVTITPHHAPSAVRTIRVAPLQPLLAAFDGAVAAAGYNTAHELAKAGIPAALFALPRPFDDQAARVARFKEASLAHALDRFEDEAILDAMTWMIGAPRPSIEGGGADRAAEVLLDLATGKAPPR